MNVQFRPNQSDIEAAIGLDRRGRGGRWLRRAVWFACLAAVAAGLAWWYVASRNEAAAITYETVAAQRVDLVVSVTASGKIQPTTQVEISSELSGIVRTVNVDNNSVVKKGDVLAELDTERLKAQMDRAQATLAAAEARIADARATMDERAQALARARTLRKKGISAVQDMDTAKAAYDRAAAGIAAMEADAAVARADLALKRTDIEKSRILSPVDGIVLKRSVEPGQTVASSLQAPVLFTLAEDLRRMQVEADVDEADIGWVKPGQKATFTVDAYLGRKFPAEIGTVEYSPTTKDNVVTYKAVLIVDNAELLLRPGMTATAEIVVKEIAQALVVPNAALRYKPPAPKKQEGFSFTRLFLPRMPRNEPSKNEDVPRGERKIWILVDGAPKELAIKPGASDGERTEVLGGDVKDGDQTIVASKQAGK
jgi:HlyD family secretion protein